MLLWLAGWGGLSDRLKHDPISRALLGWKGMGVATSAVFAPMGTAWGVWSTNQSVIAAAAAAVVVFTLVITADRAVIFAADTQSKLSWAAYFRTPLALAIALLTTFSAFVWLNKEHLEAEAADLLLTRSEQRQTQYAKATGLDDLRAADREAAERLAGLRDKRLDIPQDIVRDKAAAEACARSVERRLDGMVQRGVGRGEASRAVATARQRCETQIRDAQEKEKLYFAGVDADIARARTVADNVARQSAVALADREKLARRSNAIDSRAIEPASLAVIGRYLSAHPLAILELLAIYVAIVILDAAGLVIAAFTGRTPAGTDFERERLCATASSMADIVNAHQQILQAESLMRQSTKAAKKNAATPFIEAQFAEVQKAVARENARAVMNASPLVAAAAFINALVNAHIEAEAAARRASEVSPALGRVADRRVLQAVDDALRGVAA